MGNIKSLSEEYRQESQNQPGQRHGQQQRDSSVPGRLGDLLLNLDQEFRYYLGQIQSLQAEAPSQIVAERLYKINCNVQSRLVGLNWQMYNVQQFATPPPGPDPNIMRRLKDENKELKGKINLLESEKRHLDGLLTSTIRQKKDDSSRQHFAQTKYSHSQKEEMDRTIQQQAETLQQLEADIHDKDDEISSLNAIIASHRSYQATQENRIKNLEKKIRELSEDNQTLKPRLSKVAGQKLKENNPAITELSDPNRPTKLGEMYSDIFDNEWTDAFEQLLEAGYTEEESIDTLRLTLLNTLQFCQKKSTKLLEKTQEAVDCLFEEYREAVENKWKTKERDDAVSGRKMTPWHIVTLKATDRDDAVSGRKMEPSHLETEFTEVPKYAEVPSKRATNRIKGNLIIVQEDTSLKLLLPKWKAKERNQPQSDAVSGRKKALSHIETSFKQSKDVVKTQLIAFRKEVVESMVPLVQKAYVSASWDENCLPAMQPYIKKCLLLGWMMVVQSPPLVLDICETGSRFDRERYREYTRSGPKVQFVVWPAILLHDGGPVIGKGVAQGQS